MMSIVNAMKFLEVERASLLLSNSNIYWFIGTWIRCQQIQTMSYSVTLDYL